MTYIKHPAEPRSSAGKYRTKSTVIWSSDGATYDPSDSEGKRTWHIFGANDSIYVPAFAVAGDLAANIESEYFLNLPNSSNVDFALVTVSLTLTAITPDPYTDLTFGPGSSCAYIYAKAKRGVRSEEQRGLYSVIEDGNSMPLGTFRGYTIPGGAAVSSITGAWPPFVGSSAFPNAQNDGTGLAPGFWVGGETFAPGDRYMNTFAIGRPGSGMPSISGLSDMNLLFFLHPPQWGQGDAPTSATFAGKIVYTTYERRGDEHR